MGVSPLDLVRAADMALYHAKRSGRAQAMLLDVCDVDAPQVARDARRPPAGHEAEPLKRGAPLGTASPSD